MTSANHSTRSSRRFWWVQLTGAQRRAHAPGGGLGGGGGGRGGSRWVRGTEKPLAEAVPASRRASLTRTVTWALPVVLMSRRSEARSASRAGTRETLEPGGGGVAGGV